MFEKIFQNKKKKIELTDIVRQAVTLDSDQPKEMVKSFEIDFFFLKQTLTKYFLLKNDFSFILIHTYLF